MTKEDELEVVVEDDTNEMRDKAKKTSEKPSRDTKPPKEKDVNKEEVSKMPSFDQKLFQLVIDMYEGSKKFIKDGYNQGQNYEYVSASQYKSLFREALKKNRLRHKIDDAVSNIVIDGLKSEKMSLTQYHCVLTIKDVDSEDKETYALWSQGADNLDKGLSKAKTLALKDFIKSNYLISDREDDPEKETTFATNKPKYTSPAETKATAKKVVEKEATADKGKLARIKAGISSIRSAGGDDTYGSKALAEVETGISEVRADVLLAKIEMKASEFDIEV